MATIVRTVDIETSAEECWDALTDFGSLHRRLAPGFITDCRLVEPDVRQVTFSTGAIAKEQLVGIDEDAMRLDYASPHPGLPPAEAAEPAPSAAGSL